MSGAAAPPPAAAPLVSTEPRPVDVARIDRELAQLWAHTEEAGGEEGPVTRACMANLVVYCTGSEEAEAVTEDLVPIVARHPSRVLLLVGEAAHAAAEIDAFVSARCHLGDGGRQICSEHVSVLAQPGAAHRLPSVARPLLIGDLPTALWWTPPSPPPEAGRLVGELVDLAGQVVYDSIGWRDPAGGIVRTAEWVSSLGDDCVAADLSWRRLTPWRRLIGQSLEPAVAPGALLRITRVEVEHGPHALAPSWLLAAWLASRLGWKLGTGRRVSGQEMAWQLQGPSGAVQVRMRRLDEGAPEIRRVKLEWTSASSPVVVTFGINGEGYLGVETDGGSSPLRLPSAGGRSRSSLIAEQLLQVGPDAVFGAALAAARDMALALPR